MTRDPAAGARLEARAAADRAAAAELLDRLARQAHDDGHARIAARLAGDAGNGSVLVLAAAVPLLALVVGFTARILGAAAAVLS